MRYFERHRKKRLSTKAHLSTFVEQRVSRQIRLLAEEASDVVNTRRQPAGAHELQIGLRSATTASHGRGDPLYEADVSSLLSRQAALAPSRRHDPPRSEPLS